MQPADFLPLLSPYLNVRSTCSMIFELLWPRCRMESRSGQVSTAAVVGITHTSVSVREISALVLETACNVNSSRKPQSTATPTNRDSQKHS